ncbi:MAG: AAA family ATPase [Prosthecobacter sp.]|uniref:ParA family protein n=1 Tax=Prosthecobacter sp. TaxID=1965333 RepID=UPI001A02B5C0|nr:AAA family ATPase [Prosthecobacter sp.]MBE2284554.1 AAA family ATPase [Prosthecobacter sp.]
MPKIISVINLKGGVAKTTTTIQLAECLASAFSKRVLVIDLDPQTNATISLIPEVRWEELDSKGQTLYHLFNDKLERTKVFDLALARQRKVSNLKLRNLDLLASSIRFIDIQDRISEIPSMTGFALNPMEILKSVVHPILSEYDFVLIDCPPNLGFITRNGIEISDHYLIPSIPDTLSTYGIPQIVRKIHQFTQERPLKISCLGLVVTKYDSRSDSHSRGKRTLPARFSKIFDDLGLPQAPIFDTVMPQANATAEAMEFTNTPVSFKQKYGRSKSGDRYLYEYVEDLTRELIAHANK